MKMKTLNIAVFSWLRRVGGWYWSSVNPLSELLHESASKAVHDLYYLLHKKLLVTHTN